MNVGLNGDLLVETVGFVGVNTGFDLFWKRMMMMMMMMMMMIIIIIILTLPSKL